MSDETESVKEPTNADELQALHKMLRSDPQRYLRIVNEWIDENPANSHAYFDRHFAYAGGGAAARVGRPQRGYRTQERTRGEPTSMRASATRPPRWRVARAFRMTFGPPAFAALPAAARPALLTS